MSKEMNIIIFLVSIVVSLLLGKIILPILIKLNAGQSIREDGPKTHLSKGGTPTIGGLIFLSSLVILNFIINERNLESAMLIFATLGFGIVGFIDDYIKVIKKRNLGLTAVQKLCFQILVALILLIYQYTSSSLNTDIIIPIINKNVNIGFLYFPFIIFVIVGTVNSVNLTDGLDGLSSGITVFVLLFFSLIASIYNRSIVSVFSIILAGSLIGFLRYNSYPAKVFMGDTGSLALGGAVSAVAVLLNLPLILPIVGGVYFIETLSVIIQVVSFKTRKKRVFLMSPLHHHYEQKGWSEKKVVIVFYIAEIIFCIISYFMLV